MLATPIQPVLKLASEIRDPAAVAAHSSRGQAKYPPRALWPWHRAPNFEVIQPLGHHVSGAFLQSGARSSGATFFHPLGAFSCGCARRKAHWVPGNPAHTRFPHKRRINLASASICSSLSESPRRHHIGAPHALSSSLENLKQHAVRVLRHGFTISEVGRLRLQSLSAGTISLAAGSMAHTEQSSPKSVAVSTSAKEKIINQAKNSGFQQL